MEETDVGKGGDGGARAQRQAGAGSLMLRSLRRVCPHCGRGRIFDSWFRMRKACPECGLRLERNEESDYWVGGYLVNFIIAELIVALTIALGVIAMWPDVPWNGVLYGTAGAAIVGPLITWPFSKTLWLGIDLRFRPPEAADFDEPARTVGTQ